MFDDTKGEQKSGGGKSSSGAFFYLGLALMGIALIFLFAPRATVQHVRESEMAQTEMFMGTDAATNVVEKTNNIWLKSIINTGFLDASYALFDEAWKGDEKKPVFDDRGFGKWMRGRLDTVWLTTYHFMYRCVIFFFWMPYMLPLLFAFTADGYYTRLIGRYKFGSPSAAIYAGSTKLIIFLVSACVILPFLPIPLPPLTIPLIFTVVGVTSWSVIANTQKYL